MTDATPGNAIGEIVVRRGVDLKTFRDEILPDRRPVVVMRGRAADWPAMQAARQSPRAPSAPARPSTPGRTPPLTIRDLPPAGRAVWRLVFEYYVPTAPDEARSHRSRERRGLPGPPSTERAQAIRTILSRALAR